MPKMSDSEPSGPPAPKRRITRNCKGAFTEKELENLLYDSDNHLDNCNYTVGSDEEDSEADSEGETKNVSGQSDSESEQSVHVKQENMSPSHEAAEHEVRCSTPETAITWKNTPEAIPQIPFLATRELLTAPDGNHPIHFFNHLVDENFYKLVVEETNRYAKEIFLCTAQFSKLTRCHWKDVTVQELRTFFGLLLHMGTIPLRQLRDYWEKDQLLYMPIFAANMSRERFIVIMRCLHFNKNPSIDEPRPEDSLFKIRPLVDYFNDKMLQVYYPDKDLVLDEFMVLWRSRLRFREYIRNKKHKYGLKLFMLMEPDGMVLKFSVYTGALDDSSASSHAANIVLNLIQEKLDVGHAIFMNNYYSSYMLALELLNRQTYCTGILQTDRKHTPREIMSKRLNNLETIARYANNAQCKILRI